MAVDYLSSLNVGSGLNSTEIIDAIVNAERAPKASIIEAAKEQKTLEISSLGTVKSDFETFQTNIDLSNGVTGIGASNTGSSATISVSDKGIVSEFSNTLEISQLAASHTLVFDNFTSDDADVGSGTMSFSFGTWGSDGAFTANSDRTTVAITIDSTNNTLTGLRDEINSQSMNVTASILETSDGVYALVIKSREGESHAMEITVTEDASDTGLSTFGYTSVNSSVETIAGLDAEFEIDGVSITRESNIVDDLVDGIELTLVSTTSSAETISAAYDTDLAMLAMESLLENFNTLQASLATLTSRGLNGEEKGGLAGDPLIRSIVSQMRGYTTTAITGFGSESVYLTEFGVTTERDGSLTLDEDTFTTMFESDPDAFMAIVNSRVTTDSSLVTASVTGDSYTAGSYALAIDSDGVVTLDDETLTEYSTNSYLVTSGDAIGLQIDLTSSGADTTIYMGRSLIDTLSDYAATILDSTGQLEDKITTYNDDLTDYDDSLDKLDLRIEALRARYVSNFSAMDRAVAGLKETEAALDNLMEAWKGSMK